MQTLLLDFSKNDGLTVKAEYRECDSTVKINFMFRHTGEVSEELESAFEWISSMNHQKTQREVRVVGVKQVVDLTGNVVFFNRHVHNRHSQDKSGYIHFTFRSDDWNIQYQSGMLRKYKLENILNEVD